MKYRKHEAKEWGKENMKGVWGATYTPWTPDYKIDETGFRHNIRHCIDLKIPGMFVNGLVGEPHSQTMVERKRVLKMAVEEANGAFLILAQLGYAGVEDALEMTKYAEDIGADLVGIINPECYLGMSDEGVYQYYKYIAERVNIGICMFNQMAHGYLMSPQLMSRIADIENVVALKTYSNQDDIRWVRFLCRDKIVVSDPYEENYFISLTVHDQKVHLASPAPYLFQSKSVKLIEQYTTFAANGEFAKALDAYKKVEQIRQALQSVTFPGKRCSVFKYWAQLLGMVGGDGRVRLPGIAITEAEKQSIKAVFESTALFK